MLVVAYTSTDTVSDWPLWRRLKVAVLIPLTQCQARRLSPPGAEPLGFAGRRGPGGVCTGQEMRGGGGSERGENPLGLVLDPMVRHQSLARPPRPRPRQWAARLVRAARGEGEAARRSRAEGAGVGRNGSPGARATVSVSPPLHRAWRDTVAVKRPGRTRPHTLKVSCLETAPGRGGSGDQVPRHTGRRRRRKRPVSVAPTGAAGERPRHGVATPCGMLEQDGELQAQPATVSQLPQRPRSPRTGCRTSSGQRP